MSAEKKPLGPIPKGPVARVAVLGMGRSGTTYICKFLDECGVYTDEVNWAHEHELGRLINDTILAQHYGARVGLPYGKLPAEELVVPENWHQLARCFIRYMDAQAAAKGGGRYWLFKDPRTTILHSIWLDHFDIIVGMFRLPQEVVASYVGQKWVTGWRNRRRVLDYWMRFNQSMLHVYDHYRGKKPIYILNYNGDQRAQTEALCRELGIQITPAAAACFQESLRHYKDPQWNGSAAVRGVYERLTSITLGAK